MPRGFSRGCSGGVSRGCSERMLPPERYRAQKNYGTILVTVQKKNEQVREPSKQEMEIHMIEKDDRVVQFRVWMLGAFQVERRTEGRSWQEVPKEEWGNNTYARRLLQVLWCQGRTARRGTIIQELWGEQEPERVDEYLNKAATSLRRILQVSKHPDLFHTTHRSTYQLADQSRIWVDAEAIENLLQEAEQVGRTSSQGLTFLQEAQGYLERGAFLAEEDGVWAHGKRGVLETVGYRCALWLSDAYAAQGMLYQAEQVISIRYQRDPYDETVLRRWMALLHQQGMTQQALRLYQQTCRLFAQQGIPLSSSTEQFVLHLHDQVRPNAREVSPARTTIFPSPLKGAEPCDESPSREDHIGALPRRQAVQFLTGSTWTLLTTASREGIQADVALTERLISALKQPSKMEALFLDALETTNKTYRRHFVLAKSSLQAMQAFHRDVTAHVTTITHLLEQTSLPSVSQRLCALAAETTQLLGDIYFHEGESHVAAFHYDTALRLAREAHHAVLEAVIYGRKSFISLYKNDASRTLQILSHARVLAASTAADHVQAWLWVLEAEAQALYNERDACEQALDRSEFLLHRSHPGISTCSFDDSAPLTLHRLVSYRAACYVRLRQPEKAQPLLATYVASLKGNSLHKQAVTLVDLAKTYALQGELEAMSRYASQAVQCIAQSQSARAFQRLLQLRQDVDAWKDTQYIKQFDQQLMALSS